MSQVVLKNVQKLYGAFQALKDINVEIGNGEFVVLVGPSGCGKSTLLRMIAGLEEISGGEISIGGRVVNELEPRERDIAMVFQSYALYPHMNVTRNMSFSLELKRTPAEDTQSAVSGAAKALGLEKFLDRLPRALSGGQRQRVAMGRAIVRQPQVFLFDEPLSNLDAQLRVHMRTEVRRLHQQLNATSIYVTHDQVEAMTMADRIVVLDQGRIVQAGSPLELYERPANRFVAEFIGSPAINIVPGELSESGRLAMGNGSYQLNLKRAPAGAVDVGIRPEDLQKADNGPLAGKVTVVEHLGAETYVFLNCSGVELCWRVPGTLRINVGEQVSLAANQNHLHLFRQDTGLRLA
ncbi:ABC transporter ATP-binding protein [Solirhodobacter olei]|uniref:ABC transporter ATP-binding protein n=1 Tax=Solirhodobacter olei TaxID=2493082 RepID=UPI000FDC5B41|nr:sn-glycerol-3-phosphate ABC transporter ATP-binding protein UgpC [Solirhodobacter olei]